MNIRSFSKEKVFSKDKRRFLMLLKQRKYSLFIKFSLRKIRRSDNISLRNKSFSALQLCETWYSSASKVRAVKSSMNFLFTLQENAFLPFEATTLFTFILNFYNFRKTFDFTHIQELIMILKMKWLHLKKSFWYFLKCIYSFEATKSFTFIVNFWIFFTLYSIYSSWGFPSWNNLHLYLI